jgi:hypothetical protein
VTWNNVNQINTTSLFVIVVVAVGHGWRIGTRLLLSLLLQLSSLLLNFPQIYFMLVVFFCKDFRLATIKTVSRLAPVTLDPPHLQNSQWSRSRPQLFCSWRFCPSRAPSTSRATSRAPTRAKTAPRDWRSSTACRKTHSKYTKCSLRVNVTEWTWTWETELWKHLYRKDSWKKKEAFKCTI